MMTSANVANLITPDLIAKAHGMAREKGWWDGRMGPDGLIDRHAVLRDLPELLALVHSEISEALEAYRRGQMKMWTNHLGKPEGYVVELADVIIRCMDILGALGNMDAVALAAAGLVIHGYDISLPPIASHQLGKLHQLTAQVGVKDDNQKVVLLLAMVIIMAAMMASQHGDVSDVIRVKMAYNATRTRRHGGKVC